MQVNELGLGHGLHRQASTRKQLKSCLDLRAVHLWALYVRLGVIREGKRGRG